MATLEQDLAPSRSPLLAEGLRLERHAEKTGMMRLMGNLLLLKKMTPGLKLWMPEVPKGPTLGVQLVRSKESSENTAPSQLTKREAVARIHEAVPGFYEPKRVVFNALEVWKEPKQTDCFFRLQCNRKLADYDDGFFAERNELTVVMDTLAQEADPDFETHWKRHAPSCSVALLHLAEEGADVSHIEEISGVIRACLPIEVHFLPGQPDITKFKTHPAPEEAF
jgi:hypothetical protein